MESTSMEISDAKTAESVASDINLDEYKKVMEVICRLTTTLLFNKNNLSNLTKSFRLDEALHRGNFRECTFRSMTFNNNYNPKLFWENFLLAASRHYRVEDTTAENSRTHLILNQYMGFFVDLLIEILTNNRSICKIIRDRDLVNTETPEYHFVEPTLVEVSVPFIQFGKKGVYRRTVRLQHLPADEKTRSLIALKETIRIMIVNLGAEWNLIFDIFRKRLDARQSVARAEPLRCTTIEAIGRPPLLETTAKPSMSGQPWGPDTTPSTRQPVKPWGPSTSSGPNSDAWGQNCFWRVLPSAMVEDPLAASEVPVSTAEPSQHQHEQTPMTWAQRMELYSPQD